MDDGASGSYLFSNGFVGQFLGPRTREILREVAHSATPLGRITLYSQVSPGFRGSRPIPNPSGGASHPSRSRRTSQRCLGRESTRNRPSSEWDARTFSDRQISSRHPNVRSRGGGNARSAADLRYENVRSSPSRLDR